MTAVNIGKNTFLWELTGEDHVEYVLNGVGDQVGATASETGTLEDVDNIVPTRDQLVRRRVIPMISLDVHHDVHAGKLRPHLQAGTETNTAEDARLQQIEVGLRSFGALEDDLLLDLRELELYELVVDISATVQVGKNDECFLLTVMIDQPTRTLR